MTPAQQDFFRDHGYLRLERFHPARRIAPIRRRLQDALDLLERNRAPQSLRKLPVFQQIGKLSGLVQVPGLHDALVTPELLDLVTVLGGRRPSTVQETQLLLSPPNQGRWTLQGLNWHVDITAKGQDRPPGIQAFFLLDTTAPHGGATLALAGSHRADARRTASDLSLREVLSRGGDWEHALRELDITLVEMTGQAGDVYVMDMRLLHSPSVNAGRRMRLMATCRCLLEG